MAGKNQFSILHRILIMLLIVALVPLASVWLLTYQTSSELASEKVDQELTALNNNLTTHVDDWVEMNQRMLLQNSALQDIRSMQGFRQTPVLEAISKIYDWVYLAFTINPSGDNIGRSDGKELRPYGDREYFKQVINGNRFGQQVLIGKTSGEPALILSTAVFDNDGKLDGVLAIAMTLTDLSSQIAASRIGQTGYTFLLDEKGEVIAHPNKDFTQSRVDLSNHEAFKAIGRGETRTVFEDSNGKKVVAVARKSKQGWVMITQQDYAEAYQQIAAEKTKAFTLLGITVVIVCIVGLIATRRLTAPIRELTHVADQYSQGKLDLKISGLDRKDEIGQLANAIERLGTSIRLAMERLQKR